MQLWSLIGSLHEEAGSPFPPCRGEAEGAGAAPATSKALADSGNSRYLVPGLESGLGGPLCQPRPPWRS